MAKDINIEEEEINEDVSETNETNETNEASDTSDTSETSETSSSSEPSDSSEPELSPLEKAEKEIEQLKDQYLRARAEFENYRKRTIKEKAELILNGGEKTITAILPADNCRTEDPEAIKQGMELIFHKFVKTLEGLGVKKIETEDKPFDVDYHEAIAMVPGMGDDKKGMVIDCVQTGYMLNDKVIRHAKVAVGQ